MSKAEAGSEEFLLEARPRLPRFITDRGGVVRDANLEACLLVDMGRRFVVGKQLAVLVAHPDASRVRTALETMTDEDDSVAIKVDIRSRTGKVIAVQMQTSFENHEHVCWEASVVDPNEPEAPRANTVPRSSRLLWA